MSKPEKKSSKSSAGSDNKKGSWLFCFVAAVIIILAFLLFRQCSKNAFDNDVREREQYQGMAPKREAAQQKVQAEKERVTREDLPAGLKPTDTNYVKDPIFVGSSPAVEFNCPPNPGNRYHVYKRHAGTGWEEVGITSVNVQKYDETYRVILGTDHFINTGVETRIVISW